MYSPAAFALSEAASLDRLESRPFAVLATLGEGGLEATHLPFVLRRKPLRLVGHLARNNPQARQRAPSGLMIWSGPDAYVSPSYYPSKKDHGRVVPTWNYEAVHVEGALAWFEDPNALHGLLMAETERFEANRPDPWSVTDAPAPYIEAMIQGIVGFELTPRRIQGVQKFSQNRSPEDRAGVRQGLGRSSDPSERAAAETMAP